MADEDKNIEAEPVKEPTKDVEMDDDDVDVIEGMEDATWRDVFEACCVHTPQEWMWISVGVCLAVFFLYFFLVGLDLLGNSAKILTGCTAGSLLGDDTNPVAALMIGILATVLLQSSSTTTSIVVSLVGSGTIPTKQAIYMVMGANIGTSVTNTIVAMGQMGDGDQLERAFAGATVHDMFNFMTVAVLLPVEAATGYLYELTKAMVKGADVPDGESWEGPVKKLVDPLTDRIIKSNSSIIKAVAKGESCDSYYPVTCEDPANPTKKTCTVALIACDKKTDKCPAFFEVGASQSDEEVAGGVCFFLALIILVVCLIGLVTVLQKMLLGMSVHVIHKATNINGYIAILIGTGITMLVQSSSITTSTLTPLVGMGVIQLEQMLPLTLGANIGTTATALLASLVSESVNSLQVALAHLFFNITGILIWYPVPFMRNIPLGAARRLGTATRVWRGFPVVYIIVVFLLLPLGLLGISTLFEQDTTGFDVLGSVIVVVIFFIGAFTTYWWMYRGGRDKTVKRVQARQKRAEAVRTLPDELETLRAEIAALKEHTGLKGLEDNGDEVEEQFKENDEENAAA